MILGHRIKYATAAILLLLSQRAASAAQYQIIDLGPGNGIEPRINNLGQVLGVGPVNSLWDNGTTRSFKNSNGQFFPSFGSPLGLNNLGDVAGWGFVSVASGQHRPMAWQYDTDTVIDMGLPSGASTTNPYEAGPINDARQILVGTYGASYLWENGTFTLIPGLASDRPSAINNLGQFAGSSTLDGRLMVWSGDTINELPPLALSEPGVTTLSSVGWARDINELGQVVGFVDFGYVSQIGQHVAHAFLYTPPGVNGPAGEIVDLAGMASPFNSLAPTSRIAINDSGAMVGYWHLPGGLSPQPYPEILSPFIVQDGAVDDINTLLPESSGWTLRTASDINEAGQIVGVGRNPAGELGIYLLTPISVPEPTSFVLLAAGGLGLAALRLRHFTSLARTGS